MVLGGFVDCEKKGKERKGRKGCLRRRGKNKEGNLPHVETDGGNGVINKIT